MFRKLFAVLFLVTLANAASAQWITGFSVQPVNPTTNDQIKVIAEVQFPSGGCDDKTLNTSLNGNNIYLNALHCVGMAAYICSSTDTFQIGPLPAGTYNVYLQLNMGGGPSPCTPGIVPGPVDSIQFTVTTASGIPVLNQEGFHLYPNPGKEGCIISFSGNASPLVRISDVSGRILREYSGLQSGTYLNFNEFHSGAYLIELYDGEKLIAREKWVKE